MLILAQIAANKSQNPVNSTKHNSQFIRIIFIVNYPEFAVIQTDFFYIRYKLLYFPEIIIYAEAVAHSLILGYLWSNALNRHHQIKFLTSF